MYICWALWHNIINQIICNMIQKQYWGLQLNELSFMMLMCVRAHTHIKILIFASLNAPGHRGLFSFNAIIQLRSSLILKHISYDTERNGPTRFLLFLRFIHVHTHMESVSQKQQKSLSEWNGSECMARNDSFRVKSVFLSESHSQWEQKQQIWSGVQQ